MILIPVTPTHFDGVEQWINPDHVSRVQPIAATPSRVAHSVIHFGPGQLALAVTETAADIARMANGEPADHPAPSERTSVTQLGALVDVRDLAAGTLYDATPSRGGSSSRVTVIAVTPGMISYRPAGQLKVFGMLRHVADEYTWTLVG